MNGEPEDIVLEIKFRVSGLYYDEAKEIRDVLRETDNATMKAIVQSISECTRKIIPQAEFEIFSPWAEWRPAKGRRRIS